jgi:hypothetical protein
VAQVEIGLADLETDRELLVELLRQYSTARSNHERYRWFYLDNPHGPAEVLVARDPRTQAVIGSGAVIPRKMWVNGAVRRASVMADFWIHPGYRSLGPAVQLQRACVERAAALGFAFFDLPQGNMVAVYKRMGMLEGAALARFSRVLRAAPYVEKVVPGRLLRRLLAGIGDGMITVLDAAKARGSGLRVERHDGGFGPEFDELLRRVSPHRGVCVARSSDYLQWRYYRHYHLRYSIFTASDDSGLKAYACVVRSGSYAELVDLFPIDEKRSVVDLLLGVARLMREEGAAALAMSLLAPAGGLLGALKDAGMRARELRPFIVHEFPNAGSLAAGTRRESWFLTYGDIDY